MLYLHKKTLGLLICTGLGLTVYVWKHVGPSGGNSLPSQEEAHLLQWISQYQNTVDESGVRVKEEIAWLALNVCSCIADKESFRLPFSNWIFPRVNAHNLDNAFLESRSDPEKVKVHRAQEYSSFQKRSYTAANGLIVAEANSPLQYPTQGVVVRPLKTIILPGSDHSLNTALGTFDVAAIVEGVSLKGENENHMTLSSPNLSTLNKQLSLVTYTNTVFHPRTAENVEFGTEDHRSFFTIKIQHKRTPKLYNSGHQGEYNISALVTLATKTFLRYDKLRDLINSVRKYYPTVTIVIADDNQHPQPVTGPYIEQYFMPFGKGWFAGRNLAVSQVTTKYVLWVDDDFYFTSNTKLEKMVDILEKTTLDLVGGAVREVTGYTATYRHTISVEDGGEEGDCLHIRTGHHHTIQGFPNCVVADAVINFFMGRTDKVREVGFNPRLARHAHLEFFIDGLGLLHIASCSDVIVNHASKIKLPWAKTDTEKKYDKFRYSFNTEDNELFNEVFYFTDRFKCMTSQ
uniref:Beta-1,4 N-acetylgalactosaminyltransferase n=1 Tax=Periophthalmus magnuspinnatus TaxID=409849 RepID=A0A3B4AJN3_9GOBI